MGMVVGHVTGTTYAVNTHYATAVTSAVCPDLLRYEQIGAADNLRGRVVRAFFWLMRAWPVKP